MYTSLILNGIRSVEPLNIGSLKCFEANLKGDYSECKRYLHGVFIDLLLEEKLGTYELIKLSENKCLARIYIKEDDVINEIRSKISSILENSLTYTGEKYPQYLAIENFFDILVSAAFRKSNFKYIKGKGKVLDPNDLSKYIKKRTVVEVVRDNSNSEKYHGILFIDYSIISRSSVADKLLEELEIDDFSELREDNTLKKKSLEIASSCIGKSVLTLMKHGSEYAYVYGKITEIEPVFSSQKTLPSGQTVHELWVERFKKDEAVRSFTETKPSKWEFPLFKVEIKGRSQPLTYPPSLLRILEAVERPDPETRWDNIRRLIRIIEENIKEIYRSVTGKDIRFKYIKYFTASGNIGFRLNFYTGSESEEPYRKYTVKLKYRDIKGKEKCSLASPLYIFSKKHMPYAGKQNISLLLVYPSTLKSSNLDKFTKYLISLFKEMNFGKIDSCSRHSYNYDPVNLTESLTSLEKTLQEILPSQDQLKYLPLVIIPDNENFFKLSKEIASRYGFHSQIVRLETFDSVIKCLSEIGKPDLSDETRQKLIDAVKSLVANICGGIYVEFLIQKSIAKREVSGPLTWVLANPADKRGQSMYMGLDVSTKRGIAGAAFIVLDPYGELIGARIIQLKTETLNYQDYYDVLRYMVSRARDKDLKRIVILRDGIPKTPLELKECLKAFNTVVKELKYRASLNYISVIKRSSVRVFASNKKLKANPIQGTYIYMYKLKHFGYIAHEILVAASKPEEGTTRPVILRIYELQKEYDVSEVKRIAEEYLALTRLDFWNLRTGASRLALPVKMADILSYMLSMGIPVKA